MRHNNSIAPPGLVLQLRSGTPQELVASISAALATTTPVKRITQTRDGCVCLSLQLPRPAEASPASTADGILRATACLEHNAQVTPELLALLRQHALLSDADGASSSHTTSSSAATATTPIAARPLSAAALSPAGPLPSATGGESDTSVAAAAAAGPAHPASTQQQHLIPLLQRCGLLLSVFPEHDPTVLSHLQHKVWSRLLAPVSDFRQYFGDQVGFYLAYLNALTCWLVAPTVTSTFLLWALRRTGATGLSSPLVPVTVLFQLLWSAAGVKLWRRHQRLLRQQWQQWHHTLPDAGGPAFAHGSTSTANTSSATTNSSLSGPGGSVAALSGGAVDEGSDVAAAGRGETALTPAAPAAARQASVATSGGHFTGAVPQWAAEAPTATGTRVEFAGSWQRNARGQWLLRAPLLQQLLRVAASTLATSSLLGLAAAVLVVCLNAQGLITPLHRLLYMPRLAALSLPGGPLAAGLLKQVPMVMRVLAVSLFDAFVFGPAARALTSFENRRTVEGFDASLTVKKAALQFLFTFAPVAYVGLAGAGAAAAANDAAGYFRFELLRRIVLEFGMPWASLLLAQRRRARSKGGARNNASSSASDSSTLAGESSGRAAEFPAASEGVVAGRSAGSGGGGAGAVAVSGLSGLQQTVGVDDAAKPAFDAFTGCWDVTRDMGYVMLFASILPWAAPLTLLYTLAKVKQDCVALLLVYQRPMPRQMRNLGSWNTVLLVQVLLSVVTNVFLSGLSSGQLAQLLPGWLVPEALTQSLTAAAAARPADSTAASKLVLSESDWPPSPFAALNTLSTGANLGRVSVPGSCPAPQLFDAVSTGGRVCPAWYGPVRQPAVVHMGRPLAHVLGQQAAGISTVATTTATATSHLLLLFCIEHLLLLLVVLVMVMVPDEPAGQGHARSRNEMPQPAAELPLRQQVVGSQHGDAPGGAEGRQQQFVVQQQQQQRVVVPVVRVHGNPLFSASTAHKSGDGV